MARQLPIWRRRDKFMASTSRWGKQYVNYWRGILHGDMGRSLRFNQNVGHVIAQAYPATMELTLAALIVALGLSIPAGVRSALRRFRWDDRLLSFVSLLGLSFPNFALGPILILFFAIELGWLPVSGSGSLAHLVLLREAITLCRRTRWPPSSRGWYAPRCWKNWGRITFAPRAPKACLSARWFTGMRYAMR